MLAFLITSTEVAPPPPPQQIGSQLLSRNLAAHLDHSLPSDRRPQTRCASSAMLSDRDGRLSLLLAIDRCRCWELFCLASRALP